MKPTEFLADFIANTQVEVVPAEAIQKSQWAIIDCIAVIFAGLTSDVGQAIVPFVKEQGGNPVATILGDGHRTSAPWAAYANGTLAHAIDYDDIPKNHPGAHPTAPILPAILALGEKTGASGTDIVFSYLMGVEAESKIGMALNMAHYNLGWHPSGTLGTFGATAACCKLLKLDSEQTLMALGIAGSEASAIKQNFGTMTKPLHVGQAARNGVLAALLAARGWTADREILEGHFGFCNLFAGPGVYNLKKMTAALGQPFTIIQPGIRLKKYPCCGSIHASLHVMSELLQESPIAPEEVEIIECQIHPDRIHVLVHPDPQSGMEAKFSLEYCLAVLMLDGNLTLSHFTDERIGDQKIQSFLPRIQPLQDSNINPWSVRLRITLRDGRVLEKSGGNAPGITDWEQLVVKSRDCMGPLVPAAQIDQFLEMIQNIEDVEDIAEIIKVLVAG